MGVLPFDHGRGTVAVAARRSYYDLLVPLVVEGVGSPTATTRCAPTTASRRGRAPRPSSSAPTTPSTGRPPPGVGTTAAEQSSSLAYTFHRLITKLEHTLSGGGLLTLSGMVGVDYLDTVSTQPGQGDRTLASVGSILGERASLRLPTGRYLTTTVGLDVLTISFDADARLPLPPNIGGVPPPAFDPTLVSLNTRVTQLSVALYAEETLRVGRVELTAGTRLDRLIYGNVQTFIVDPRAVLRVRPTDAVTVTASSGFFHQPPPFVQLAPGVGNPDLVPQRSWQNSLGVELNLPLNFEARLTGFYNQMFNLQRATSEVVDTPTGPRRLFFADDGQGRSYGLEVMLRRRLERGSSAGSATRSPAASATWRGATWSPSTSTRPTCSTSRSRGTSTTTGASAGASSSPPGSPTRTVTGAFYDADVDRHRPLYLAQMDGSLRSASPPSTSSTCGWTTASAWGPST
jgi:hypothetical protein